MPRRRDDSHAEAVTRRLALLSAELAATAADAEPRSYDGDAHDGDTHDGDTHDGHTRLRVSQSRPEPRPEPSWDLEVPLPGRHAARARERPRLRELLADALPETLQGRVRLGAPQLAVVAVVVAAGLLLTAWWTVRSRSSGEVLPPVAVVSGLQTPAASGATVGLRPAPLPSGGVRSGPASSAPASGGVDVVVDVTGKVRRPGIVVLPVGSRVVDALKAAGGARPRVDLGELNQARVLVDGEQIAVGVVAATGVAAPAAPSGSPTGQLIDVNTADETLLERLPGVGPVTAQAIIDWRTQNGAFTSVDGLLEVSGIGDATLADLAPYVTI